MNNKKRNLFHLWEELNRRKVVRVVLVYLAAAYAILESSDIILPRLGLAEWTVNMVMIILFIGLIVVIILAWVYDITPEGIRVTEMDNGKGAGISREKLENTTIANYLILEKLGSSKLGTTYRAKDTVLKRSIALIFLADWICADKTIRARLIESIQAAAGKKLENESVIYSVEKDHDLVFLVMELNNVDITYNTIPVELQSIIIEAIKEEPFEPDDIDNIAATVYNAQHSGAIGPKDQSNIIETGVRGTRKHLSFPKLISAKKTTIPLIIIIVLLIAVFNWSGIENVLGISKNKRETAKSYIKDGEYYFDLGNYDAAKEYFEYAIEADPGYSVAWSNLAVVCVKQDNISDAIMHTIKAVELDKNNKKAAYSLAYELDIKGDFIQAEEWYSRAIEIDSTFLPAYSALGRVYNSSGRPVKAILLLKQALNRFPESDSLYLIQRNLGYAYFLMEQIDESLRYLNMAYESQPSDCEIILYLAKSHEAGNEISRSIEFWEKYIELETDSLKVEDGRQNLMRITREYLDELENK